MTFQKEIKLGPFKRGFHIITANIVNQLPVMTGVVNVFIKHTSASLTINENADPTVRDDFETHFNKMVPEKDPNYEHTFEGNDDMPAHLKSSILGNSISIPIKRGAKIVHVPSCIICIILRSPYRC